MQNSSAFQFIAIDTIHESTTNPRQSFEEAKLHELAESLRQHGTKPSKYLTYRSVQRAVGAA